MAKSEHVPPKIKRGFEYGMCLEVKETG